MHLVFSKKSKGKLTGEDAAAGAGPDEPSAPVLMALPTAASPADCPDELNELEEPTSMRSSILGCAPPAQAQAALCPTGATLTRILALGAGCQRERGGVLPIGEAVTAEHDRLGHRCFRTTHRFNSTITTLVRREYDHSSTSQACPMFCWDREI